MHLASALPRCRQLWPRQAGNNAVTPTPAALAATRTRRAAEVADRKGRQSYGDGGGESHWVSPESGCSPSPGATGQTHDCAFLGTLAPFFRASESPIAIACLRLFTTPPLPPFPERSVPFFSRRTAFSTLLPAALPYLRLLDFLREPALLRIAIASSQKHGYAERSVARNAKLRCRNVAFRCRKQSEG
jgi:hypothetical protein